MKTSIKLIIIDDSSDDALLLIRNLEHANYEMDWVRVETEAELTRKLNATLPDLIISDYSMPKFNGLAALSVVKKMQLDIPFLIVSGAVGEELATDVMRAGAHDYLMKDNLTRLSPAVKRELKEAQVRREARQAQDDLRISEQRLQLALVGADHAIWDWNIANNTVYFSPQWAAMHGLSTTVVQLDNSFWEKLFHPEDVNDANQVFQALRKGKIKNIETEFRIKIKSGEWKWIQTRGKVTDRDNQGLPKRATGTLKDITEKKKLEEQLRQAQKMESIGLLAGGIAHDFNNLLTVILGHVNLEVVNLRRAGEPESNVLQSLEQIGHAAERAAVLTRQLLAFSRKNVMQLEVLSPSKILKGMEPMMQRLIGETIALSISINDGVDNIRADSGLIEQIVMNLIINARDAMPDGGNLTIELSNTKLVRNADLPNLNDQKVPGVLLSVQDTGIGMSKQMLARIFEPFYTTKPVGKGTGLGLATVYGIVKQFGGHIEAESELNNGTTFRVYFPAVMAQVTAQRKTREADTLGGKETVLLCEDEEIVRNLSELILKRAGYKVILAENGQTALEQAKKHAGSIDILITDVVMPDMSGFMLAQTLNERKFNLPVLFVSGYNEEIIAEIELLDEIEFLNKPFRPKELLQRVRYVIEQNKVTKQPVSEVAP